MYPYPVCLFIFIYTHTHIYICNMYIYLQYMHIALGHAYEYRRLSRRREGADGLAARSSFQFQFLPERCLPDVIGSSQRRTPKIRRANKDRHGFAPACRPRCSRPPEHPPTGGGGSMHRCSRCDEVEVAKAVEAEVVVVVHGGSHSGVALPRW